MRFKKDLIIKWIGEGLIIFISVVSAFWMEEFRQNKQEKEDYVTLLWAFRNNLHTQLGHMRFSYDPQYNNRTDQPYLLAMDSVISIADSLVKNGDRKSIETALNMIIHLETRNDWRHEANYFQYLQLHSRLIIEDQLEATGRIYHRIMESEYLPMEEIKKSKLQLIEDISNDVDLTGEITLSQSQADQILFLLKNRIWEIKTNCARSKTVDMENAVDFSLLIYNMDKILLKHGVDTSKLEKKFLLDVKEPE